jgi:hypothetical protein
MALFPSVGDVCSAGLAQALTASPAAAAADARRNDRREDLTLSIVSLLLFKMDVSSAVHLSL